ncbi:hypothetical protein FA534_13960 [Pseudomonas aeruginosa]|nr:hypothetical protein [Pseudomonas aeruginosa]
MQQVAKRAMTDTPDDRTGDASGLSKRQAFHRQHRQRAKEEARRLLDARAEQGGRWLDWVAGQLYLLRPPEYAAMVRRELQRLSGD